jgi:hypothetical protein
MRSSETWWVSASWGCPGSVRAHGEQEQRMPIERKETIDGLAPIVGSAISATVSIVG